MTPIRRALHQAADLIADAIEEEFHGKPDQPRRKTRAPQRRPPKLAVVPTDLQRAKAQRTLEGRGVI